MNNLNFDDLENLDDLKRSDKPLPVKRTGGDLTYISTSKNHREDCPSCRGKGRFISWSGRDVGECYKCKGKGFLMFAQPAEVRERNRVQRQAHAERAKLTKIEAFAEQHPDVHQWLVASAPTFDFAASLLAGLKKYGSLTDKQLAAVNKCINKKKQSATDAKKREANAVTVEVSRIKEAFDTATSNGLKHPKLRLRDFVFSLAPATGVNAGAIYVKEGETYLGKIVEGKLIRSRDCDDDAESKIVEAVADPEAAAVAHGKQTGSCSCCGRELTDPNSIERGIGPICAENFGF